MIKPVCIQGDLFIIKADIPTGAKKRDSNVLVYGESTGHAHRLTLGEVYDLEDHVLFTVPAGATIIHEEHKEIPINKGDYEVIRQRQKTGKDMVELIVD